MTVNGTFAGFSRAMEDAQANPISGVVNLVSGRNLAGLPPTVLINVLGRLADTALQRFGVASFYPTTPVAGVGHGIAQPVAGVTRAVALDTPFRSAPKGPIDV